MEVSKTNYLKIDFDEDTKMLIALWYSESGNLDTENFKQELYKWRDCIRQYKPVRLLIDSRKMDFAIAPVIQEWFVTDIFPAYASVGVKRNAFIESEEMITALSIEQSIDENKNAPFETMYFYNKADAEKWLLDK